jgi:hypothetical protein
MRQVRTISVVALLVLGALLAGQVAVAAPFSMHLKRQPHVFTPGGASKKGAKHGQQVGSWKDAGRTVPLNGGTFTVGAFYLDLTVGTGAAQQTFQVIVDTGSSNTAVPAVGCTSCGLTSGYYNASASPTAVPLSCNSTECKRCKPVPITKPVAQQHKKNSMFVHAQDTTVAPMPPNPPAPAEDCKYGEPLCTNDQCGFVISYGGSNTFTQGTIVQDTACFGGACADGVYIDQMDSQYPSSNMPNGIIGFAYPDNACNPTCQPTILDTFVEKGTLKPEENLFGLCLTQSNGGILDLGYFNTSRLAVTKSPSADPSDLFDWAPIVKEHWFNIDVMAMYIGGIDSQVPAYAFGVFNDAIGSFVDSGTSILLMSPAAFGGFTSTMSNNFATLPGLSSFLSGQSASLSAQELAMYPSIAFLVRGEKGKMFNVTVDAADYMLPVGFGSYQMGVQGVPSIGLVMGDVIMQRYYIAFDRVGRRIGFAKLGSC